jgi:hypothetical protein
MVELYEKSRIAPKQVRDLVRLLFFPLRMVRNYVYLVGKFIHICRVLLNLFE